MSAVTRYTLALRIADLESRQRSIKEDFQLEAYRMLMRGDCLHEWTGQGDHLQCVRCGEIYFSDTSHLQMVKK